VNAALLAAAILARSDAELEDRLLAFRLEQAQAVLDVGDPREG
jgi:phosphoribosylcarboxyaminoimidazole (NCAIR) mutase